MTGEPCSQRFCASRAPGVLAAMTSRDQRGRPPSVEQGRAFALSKTAHEGEARSSAKPRRRRRAPGLLSAPSMTSLAAQTMTSLTAHEPIGGQTNRDDDVEPSPLSAPPMTSLTAQTMTSLTVHAPMGGVAPPGSRSASSAAVQRVVHGRATRRPRTIQHQNGPSAPFRMYWTREGSAFAPETPASRG